MHTPVAMTGSWGGSRLVDIDASAACGAVDHPVVDLDSQGRMRAAGPPVG
jgi:hypothetical protein